MIFLNNVGLDHMVWDIIFTATPACDLSHHLAKDHSQALELAALSQYTV